MAKEPKIADDYVSIARRMKELEWERDYAKMQAACDDEAEDDSGPFADPTPVPTPMQVKIARLTRSLTAPSCTRCSGKGWRYNQSRSRFVICSTCGNPNGFATP